MATVAGSRAPNRAPIPVTVPILAPDSRPVMAMAPYIALRPDKAPALDPVASFLATWNCLVGTGLHPVPRSRHPTRLRTSSRKPAQNVTGYSKATFGSGCPAGGKKCDQGGGIVAFYYGAAAEVNSCLDEYTDDDYGSSSDYGSGSDYGYSGDGGSSSYDDGGSSSYDSGTYYDGDYVLPDDYYGGLDIQSGSNATITGSVYSCKAVSSGHSYCGEISQSSSEVNDFRAGCNEERGTLGTGCPASSKKCQFDELLIYFYDTADMAMSCEELYETDW